MRPKLLIAFLMVMALIASACSISDSLTLEDPNDTRPESDRREESDDNAAEGSEDDEPRGQREEDVLPGNPLPGQNFQVPGPHPALAELAGQLAITNEADVVVARPNGSERRIVDGSSIREVIASQPVWSTSGTFLAWSAFNQDEQSVVVLEATEAEPLISDASGSPVYYLQWRPDDLSLVSLRNAQSGGVEASTVTPGEPIVPFSSGQPFFVSWGPTNQQLAAHVGSRIEPGTLSLFEPSLGASSTPIISETVPFGAPDWLDDTTLIGATDEGLVRVDTETLEQEVLVPLTPPVQFVVSPDGARVAYRGSAAGEEQPLQVLDVATGESTTVLETDAIAWEWSPDGQRLAVLTTAVALAGGGISEIGIVPTQSDGDDDGSGRFQWAFWSAAGSTPGFFGATPAHEPSSLEISSYLPFFEQYAQSHHRWSPDSSAFAFAGTLTSPDGETFSGIYVQLAGDPSTFSLVGDGQHVTWSTSGLAAGVSPA